MTEVHRQDNSSEHTVAATMHWFGSNHIHLLKIPNQSTNINPSENRWEELKTGVYRGCLFNLLEFNLLKMQNVKKEINICILFVKHFENQFFPLDNYLCTGVGLSHEIALNYIITATTKYEEVWGAWIFLQG